MKLAELVTERCLALSPHGNRCQKDRGHYGGHQAWFMLDTTGVRLTEAWPEDGASGEGDTDEDQ